MADTTRIVVLGGGYAGVEAVKVLHKSFRKDRSVEITLVDRNPFHTLMTELHEVAGGRVEPESVQISFEKIFGGKRVNRVVDRIRTIDFAAKKLVSDRAEYPYDYLVIGAGGEPEFFGIPGIKEFAFTLWSFEDALRIRRHVEDMFRRAAAEADPKRRAEYLTFVVAGAGFTGIELAGELKDWRTVLCREHHVSESDVRIVVIEALDTVLPTMPGPSPAEGDALPQAQGRRGHAEVADRRRRRGHGAPEGRQGHRRQDVRVDVRHPGVRVRRQPPPGQGQVLEPVVQVRHHPGHLRAEGVPVRQGPVRRGEARAPARERADADAGLPRGVRRGRRRLVPRGQEGAAADRRDGRADRGDRGAQHRRGHPRHAAEVPPLELPRQHGLDRREVGRCVRRHGPALRPAVGHLRDGREARDQRPAPLRRGGREPGVAVPQARVPRRPGTTGPRSAATSRGRPAGTGSPFCGCSSA